MLYRRQSAMQKAKKKIGELYDTKKQNDDKFGLRDFEKWCTKSKQNSNFDGKENASAKEVTDVHDLGNTRFEIAAPGPSLQQALQHARQSARQPARQQRCTCQALDTDLRSRDHLRMRAFPNERTSGCSTSCRCTYGGTGARFPNARVNPRVVEANGR